jgi:hypothetical protein
MEVDNDQANFERGDVLSEIRELGMEALGAYVSFHAPFADGRWGIFLLNTELLNSPPRSALSESWIGCDP